MMVISQINISETESKDKLEIITTATLIWFVLLKMCLRTTYIVIEFYCLNVS